MVAIDTDQAGVMTEYESAVAPLRAEVLRHCYRMLGSWDEAEDAAQETLLRGWRGWDAFEARASVRTWLHRIATNVCLRLALIAGLQTLPPTQRAILLLRDVLAFSTAEVADLLQLSAASVKGSLQRARAKIAAVAPEPEDVLEPSSPEARRLVDVYVGAFERADVGRLTEVLRADATLELLPGPDWYAGKIACSRVFADAVGSPGDWSMVPTIANGQPAVRVLLHGEPLGISVLDLRRDGIAAVTVFGTPDLVARFTS
jgi:DNA-directed RNA polymerase specialized sigma24 family protein